MTLILLCPTKDLNTALFYIFVLGMTFSGKHIVFLNYVVEVMPENRQQATVNLIVMLENCAVVLMAFIY